MFFGDLQIYDIIIFAAIAVFLVFRLNKVLGRRTGLEKNQEKNLNQANNIIKENNEKKIVPELNDKLIKLKKAYEVLENFDHKTFLEGAKVAFETIINAFNTGDNKTLKGLLNEKTYVIFEKAINEKNNDPKDQLFSFNIEKIENVLIEQGKIIISIKFISEHFKNNDESTILKKEDVWSFEKPIKSKNPNWFLCST